MKGYKDSTKTQWLKDAPAPASAPKPRPMAKGFKAAPPVMKKAMGKAKC